MEESGPQQVALTEAEETERRVRELLAAQEAKEAAIRDCRTTIDEALRKYQCDIVPVINIIGTRLQGRCMVVYRAQSEESK